MALEIEKSGIRHLSCRAIVINGTGFISEKKLIMVPTPGQAEQHYLVKRIEIMNMGVIWNMENRNGSRLNRRLIKKKMNLVLKINQSCWKEPLCHYIS